MIASIFHAVVLGFKSLILHKLRSGLTVLGIIFGVCSVITMLAIGEGASHETQQRIRHLGSNNIIVETLKPGKEEDSQRQYVLKYGLTYLDMERISKTVKGVNELVPIRQINEPIVFENKSENIQVQGTHANYALVKNVNVIKGRFLQESDITEQRNVCVLSRSVATQLFTHHEPLGQAVKVKGHYFQVVGVIDEQGENSERSASKNAYIPLSTMKSRFGDLIIESSSGSHSLEMLEIHTLIIQMNSPKSVLAGEAQVANLLKYGHSKKDYKVVVPLQLLREAEASKRMFNIVLGSIAAISLIVGGIGIMNIMLATVTERTREIGLRRALGARKKDIVSQFMVESILLSISGGFIGILLGVAMPQMISRFAGMLAIVSPTSVLVAFCVSVFIGVVFGIYPAAKSAQLDPIEALRND